MFIFILLAFVFICDYYFINVGNSLGLGVGTHLAASYPYLADIGVGAVAYFIPKVSYDLRF